MSNSLTTPFDSSFTRQTIFITPEIINNQYVIFSVAPIVETVQILIFEENPILLSEFEIIIIDDTNISEYIDCAVGQTILSWKNSIEDIQRLILGTDEIEIMYISE